MNYITVVRGKLKAADLAEAQAAHDAIVAKLSAMTRPLGAIGHQPYLNPQSPGEFLAIDTWNNLEALQQFLSNPDVAAELGGMFAGQPDVSVWAESDWAAFKD
jgi:quinol monooxygenase YgiN